jgi:hypothetical protein
MAVQMHNSTQECALVTCKVAVTVLCGTILSVQAVPQEKQAEPPKQAAPRAEPPRQQAKPPKQQAPQRAEQPKAQPQQQQKAQRPAAQPPAKPAQPQRARQPAPKAPPHTQQPPPQRAQQPAQKAQPAPARNAGANNAPPQRPAQQAQAWQQKGAWKANGGWQGGANFQAARASNWSSEHRSWAQRGGYGGYTIPQAQFGLYFGAGHTFRIGMQPTIMNGYPRFQYGGFTFMMVDPWPADWGPDWYQTDPLYVGYDNGYYLNDEAHPGEAVAIAVVT